MLAAVPANIRSRSWSEINEKHPCLMRAQETAVGIYEKLWIDAESAFEQGTPQTDPCLADKTHDLRRGVTLVLRPSVFVCEKLKDFLDRLAIVCPDQYIYRPEEFHVTVLSIISGSEFWRSEIRSLVLCRRIISSVLARQHSFMIGFKGVTASPGTVMIQGFPLCDGLANIRNELREAFARNGLGGMPDRRYRSRTAHITAMRFKNRSGNWKRLASLLKENRQTEFGVAKVQNLQLIWGDWYASADIVRTLQQYHLSV
jgi:2'-5' RNA ligase